MQMKAGAARLLAPSEGANYKRGLITHSERGPVPRAGAGTGLVSPLLPGTSRAEKRWQEKKGWEKKKIIFQRKERSFSDFFVVLVLLGFWLGLFFFFPLFSSQRFVGEMIL